MRMTTTQRYNIFLKTIKHFIPCQRIVYQRNGKNEKKSYWERELSDCKDLMHNILMTYDLELRPFFILQNMYVMCLPNFKVLNAIVSFCNLFCFKVLKLKFGYCYVYFLIKIIYTILIHYDQLMTAIWKKSISLMGNIVHIDCFMHLLLLIFFKDIYWENRGNSS